MPPPHIKVSRGRHSLVLAFPSFKVAIKIYRRGLLANAKKEFEFLRTLSEKKFNVPKPYELIIHEYPILVREYIEGKHLKDFFNESSPNEIVKVLKDLLIIAHKLDNENIFLDELSYPTKNVIVTKDLRVYIIDLERAVRTRNRSNVTQLLGFLYRIGISSSVLKQKLENHINFNVIRRLGQIYKVKREIKCVLDEFFL